MKAKKLTLAGRERYLFFNGEAMFRVNEKFGGIKALMETISEQDESKAPTHKAFSAACEAAAILAEQGELARRYLGYDKDEIVTTEAIRATVTPEDITALMLAIPIAINAGFDRKIEDENEEVDLVLLELQKKTR